MNKNTNQLDDFSRQALISLGQGKTTLLISLVSVVTSVLVTLIFGIILNRRGVEFDIAGAVFISLIVPGVIVPLISWYFLKLFLRVQMLEEEVKELSARDALTGLLTRKEFYLQAQNYIQHAVKGSYTFSLLLADLDKFEDINEKFGNLVGDKVLAQFGHTVTELTRDSDITAHFREDEFIFLLPHTTAKQALSFCKRLSDALKETKVEEDGKKISFTTSLGVATYPDIGTLEMEKMVNMASRALAEAKDHGRDQALVYHQGLEDKPES